MRLVVADAVAVAVVAIGVTAAVAAPSSVSVMLLSRNPCANPPHFRNYVLTPPLNLNPPKTARGTHVIKFFEAFSGEGLISDQGQNW